MKSEKKAEVEPVRFSFHEGPPPGLEGILLEREIPSDPALVAPLVVRTLEFLRAKALVRPEEENKVGLCLDEALQNGIIHGNQQEFSRKVRLVVFLGGGELGFQVSDEGDGFDPGKLRDPLEPSSLWGESGRGIYLIKHWMDRTEFYDGGSTIVMARRV